MRVFFIGCVEFSKRALERLLEMQSIEIVGVGTKDNSSFNSDFCDLSDMAKNNGIPYIYIKDINSGDTKDFIDSARPDIVYCFGWSSLIKEKLLNSYPIIGFHPAAIPANRGRHPLIWAMALGLKESASSFFLMDSGADSGAIISQVPFSISYFDTAKSLYDKVTHIALDQIEHFSNEISTLYMGGGTIPSQNQTQTKDSIYLRKNLLQILREISTPQDFTQTNLWRKRGVADGRIDFRMSSNAIYNLIRALGKPYIGAEVLYKGEYIKIWAAQEIAESKSNIESGKVLRVNCDGVLVKCYENAILLKEHEFILMPKEGEYLI